MAKTFDELIAERKGISLEEYQEEKIMLEEQYRQEKLEGDISNFVINYIAPSLIIIISTFIIAKIIKRELTKIAPGTAKQSNIFKSEYSLIFITGIFILVGILDMPYVYYALLRIFVLVASLFTIYLSSYTNNFTKAFLLFIVLLFNPVAPIELDKTTWIILDFIFGAAAIIIALYNHYSYTRKCPKCENILVSGSIYCNSCGEYVQLAPIIKEKSASFEPKPLPMKWFEFLVNFLMPLWLFTGALGVLNRAITVYDTYAHYDSSILFKLTDIISIILAIFMVVFLFLTRMELKNFTSNGYKYAILFFTLTLSMPTIIMIIYLPSYASVNASYDFYNLFITTASALIICVPNIIYFKKRKHLFNEHNLNSDIRS